MRILLVEDEQYIASAVAESLKKNRCAVDLAFDGEYGLDCALTGIYDAIILDVMLPKKDGFTVLKELRAGGVTTPVILLTAKTEVGDRIRGLDTGADDYLVKPFHMDELMARVRALSRRPTEFHPGGVCAYGDIELDPRALTLRRGTSSAGLTPKEAQILEVLVARRENAVSKDVIIEKVWGYDGDAEDNSVEKHISTLRKKLAQLGSDVSIRTVRGMGYRLNTGVL
ncbi:MAG: response regulator transcription factor [Oscillospiraceae bacterium]|nr:response regulator transcription factor [Oscillospiraceae bacterium]